MASTLRRLYRLVTSKWARKVWRLDRARRRLVADADVVVVSFPKSGRTWLRALITTLYQRRYDLPERSLIEHDNLHKLNPAIPKIFFTHDCDPLGSVVDIRPRRPEYIGRKIVFLMRHPADVAVSHYYQLKHRKAGKRENATRGMSLFDFVTEPGRGIEYIIAFMNQWYQFAQDTPNVCIIRYEELKQEPDSTLIRLSGFLGTSFSKAEIVEAINACSFENLQLREREGFYDDTALRPADSRDPNSFKVRRGRARGYTEDLGQDEIAAVEHIIRTRLEPSMGYQNG